jgi:hypothetical protein
MDKCGFVNESCRTRSVSHDSTTGAEDCRGKMGKYFDLLFSVRARECRHFRGKERKSEQDTVEHCTIRIIMYSIPMLITFLTTMGPLLPELAKPQNKQDVDKIVKDLRDVLPGLFPFSFVLTSLLLKPEGEQLPAAQWLQQIQVSATLCRE